MRLVASLLLAFLAGFMGHQVRPVLRRDFQGGWFPISCYVVGVSVTLPFVLLIDRVLGRNSGNRPARLAASYLLAFLGVGSGVVTGHYWDGGG